MENLVYEFTEEQNKVIKRLTANMFFVGIFVLLLGVFAGILDIYYWFTPDKNIIVKIFVAIVGFVTIMMGLFTLTSSRSFRQVFISEGNDVDHLMKAIDKLATWFGILTFVIIVALAIVILGAVASLML
jgi:hypothetical protein